MSRHSLSILLAAGVLTLAATAAAAKDSDKFPLELTIKDEVGNPVAGAAVTVTAGSGEPFTASGVTTAEGRYDLQLPDFSRAYQGTIRYIHLGLAGVRTPRAKRARSTAPCTFKKLRIWLRPGM